MTQQSKNQPAETPETPEISYPCTWVYKVIGENRTLLKDIIIETCAPLDVTISHSHSSSKGKYHSLNAELIVPDEKSRLMIYDSLKKNPAVKIVL